MSDFDRYARQLKVSGFDEQAQKLLNSARVVLIGAGGLGAPVAAQLAGAGVGEIHIVDFDQISLSNLHRQWLYSEQQVGSYKVDRLCQHLKNLNSQCTIHAHNERLTPDNVERLIQNANLVIDAADNFAASYLLSQQCAKNNIGLLTASVNQRFGYVSLLCANGAATLEDVFQQLPMTQTSCDVVGVSGPAVTTIAGLQAQAALDWLTNPTESLLGKLLYFDLRNYQTTLLNCPDARADRQQNIEFICAKDIQSSDYVIDVREAQEVCDQAADHRVDINTPLLQINPVDLTISKDINRMVFACRSGQRALNAALKVNAHSPLAVAVILPTQAD